MVACGLLAAAVLVLRSGNGLPWPALGLASLTSAICFTVGGSTGSSRSGPDLATLSGAIVGVMTIAAAIAALVPRHDEHPTPSRIPIVIATAGVVIGACGLVISLLTT